MNIFFSNVCKWVKSLSFCIVDSRLHIQTILVKYVMMVRMLIPNDRPWWEPKLLAKINSKSMDGLWLTRDRFAYVSMYLLLGCSTKKCKVIGLSLKHRETDLADGKFNQILFIFLLKLFRIRCQIYRKRISYVLY